MPIACRRVTEGRRNRSNALGKAFRSGGTESSNPASSSSQSVSAVNPEAIGEKPRTLAASEGRFGKQDFVYIPEEEGGVSGVGGTMPRSGGEIKRQ